MEALQINDPVDLLLLLLPVTAEHTIDGRSPLFGHMHKSLTVSTCLLGAYVCPVVHVALQICRAAPVAAKHTIDERIPLSGHTHELLTMSACWKSHGLPQHECCPMCCSV